jgi:hypothetical protein
MATVTSRRNHHHHDYIEIKIDVYNNCDRFTYSLRTYNYKLFISLISADMF